VQVGIILLLSRLVKTPEALFRANAKSAERKLKRVETKDLSY
jgi:hypothetical protein